MDRNTTTVGVDIISTDNELFGWVLHMELVKDVFECSNSLIHSSTNSLVWLDNDNSIRFLMHQMNMQWMRILGI